MRWTLTQTSKPVHARLRGRFGRRPPRGDRAVQNQRWSSRRDSERAGDLRARQLRLERIARPRPHGAGIVRGHLHRRWHLQPHHVGAAVPRRRRRRARAAVRAPDPGSPDGRADGAALVGPDVCADVEAVALAVAPAHVRSDGVVLVCRYRFESGFLRQGRVQRLHEIQPLLYGPRRILHFDCGERALPSLGRLARLGCHRRRRRLSLSVLRQLERRLRRRL
mmetsp:Transcript_28646/g.96469  ORF Transcript_28646/g.96469 Transcript_28646/m.96469 type:complete len:222 (-) Transcript_28646:907-1572(-)